MFSEDKDKGFAFRLTALDRAIDAAKLADINGTPDEILKVAKAFLAFLTEGDEATALTPTP